MNPERFYESEMIMTAEQMSGEPDALDPNYDVYADFVPTPDDLDAAYAQRDLDINLARGDINVMTSTTEELAADIRQRIGKIDERIARFGQPSTLITDNEADRVFPGADYQQRRQKPHMIIGHVDEDNRRWVPKLLRNMSIRRLQDKRRQTINKMAPDRETREALNDIAVAGDAATAEVARRRLYTSITPRQRVTTKQVSLKMAEKLISARMPRPLPGDEHEDPFANHDEYLDALSKS